MSQISDPAQFFPSTLKWVCLIFFIGIVVMMAVSMYISPQAMDRHLIHQQSDTDLEQPTPVPSENLPAASTLGAQSSTVEIEQPSSDQLHSISAPSPTPSITGHEAQQSNPTQSLDSNPSETDSSNNSPDHDQQGEPTSLHSKCTIDQIKAIQIKRLKYYLTKHSHLKWFHSIDHIRGVEIKGCFASKKEAAQHGYILVAPNIEDIKRLLNYR